MRGMTKNQFKAFAFERGVVVKYSGKLRKFFMRKISKMDINTVINSKFIDDRRLFKKFRGITTIKSTKVRKR